MEVRQLKDDMDRQFTGVAEQFAGVAEQFAGVAVQFIELKGDMDRQFAGVAAQFKEVDRRFEEVIALITSEAERTRRHFDVVAERLISERNLVIDKALAVDQRVGRLTASNAADHVGFTARLGDHEQRLTDLEPKDKL